MCPPEVTAGGYQGEGDRGSDALGAERDRLIAAFGRAASEHGLRALTVAQVTHYAGLTTAEFERHLGSKEGGLLAAQDAYLDRLWLDVREACAGPAIWPDKVSFAIKALIASLAETSDLARVFVVEAWVDSFAAVERQFATLDSFAALLSEGRRFYPQASTLPSITERVLVGGIASIVRGRLLAEEPRSLAALEPELVELVLIPYLGLAEARRIART
jgi:AcrR family transcriptional regulator